MNKVLIIDDDKELCALIKRSVLSEDIEADFCNTGKEGLQKLKEKERYVLTSRYFIGKTQMELAEEIGISQAQISRLEKSGIDHIKKMIQ